MNSADDDASLVEDKDKGAAGAVKKALEATNELSPVELAARRGEQANRTEIGPEIEANGNYV